MTLKRVNVTTTELQRQEIARQATNESTWTQSELAAWATTRFKLMVPMDRTTISKILKKARSTDAIADYRLQRTNTTTARLPELELELLEWVTAANKIVSETSELIKAEAATIARRMQITPNACALLHRLVVSVPKAIRHQEQSRPWCGGLL